MAALGNILMGVAFLPLTASLIFGPEKKSLVVAALLFGAGMLMIGAIN